MPIYVEMGDIQGSVTNASYTNQVEFMSMSWGVSRTFAMRTGASGTGGSATADAPTFGEVALMKYMDKASPKLFQKTAQGEHIETVTIHCIGTYQGQEQEFAQYKLTDVVVTNYQVSGSGGGEFPTESITLAYSKIEHTFNDRDVDGNLTPTTAGWDIKANTKV